MFVCVLLNSLFARNITYKLINAMKATNDHRNETGRGNKNKADKQSLVRPVVLLTNLITVPTHH